MTEAGSDQAGHVPIEDVFADELARGDIVLGTAGPMLGMLLANHDNGLFSEEIVARVRGMVASVARQFLEMEAEAAAADDPAPYVADRETGLCAALAGHLPLLGHCHALAIEHRLATGLERRSAIDPVLSPMLQGLVADPDDGVASLAMALLTAQARFVQQQRRMELPLYELPKGLCDALCRIWREREDGASDETVREACAQLGAMRDKQPARVAMAERLLQSAAPPEKAALSVSHAGVALFLTALARGAELDRDIAALATNQSQSGRLVLMLRAAGAKPVTIVEQFLLIHPDLSLPREVETLRMGPARTLLAASPRQALD